MIKHTASKTTTTGRRIKMKLNSTIVKPKSSKKYFDANTVDIPRQQLSTRSVDVSMYTSAGYKKRLLETRKRIEIRVGGFVC